MAWPYARAIEGDRVICPMCDAKMKRTKYHDHCVENHPETEVVLIKGV